MVKAISWMSSGTLLRLNVLDIEDLKGIKGKLLELLATSSEDIRLKVWENVVPDMLKLHILNEDDIQETKSDFLNVLVSGNPSIIYDAWNNATELLKESLLTNDDLISLMDKFIPTLSI